MAQEEWVLMSELCVDLSFHIFLKKIEKKTGGARGLGAGVRTLCGFVFSFCFQKKYLNILLKYFFI